ncbi:shugoshin 1 [Xenopus laevis]|uniref:Shugoshin 1 n=3 Tax=Xenopus laevis TaxID=8355 RepID=SGO1_XENLA|nr:shugoshin 1 [Xenopus laevis]XP_018122217.1 shugoshin 1 [Xenopus laevis]Q4KLP8.1 RecName: Full=Shugoshin 1; AltName: Full=Shugoshin-like 1 [Xenopus laevis]AAH99060.1 MGC115705 protein [Xenopus laevis]OCT75851.1 hypothetical protein XELAEV_18031038mg [Xenopus laevis]
MVKERCPKQAFQDSLEDIKERMKEKRIKKLAKVATVNKTLCTKVQILNSGSTAIKNYKANNTALALALEAEKLKTRQAQDLILGLKREHQRLIFEIFMLRRRLQSQQGRDTAESKLASLKDIIAKVTHNLLETASLLEPAHLLCSSANNNTPNPSKVEEKLSSGASAILRLPSHAPISDTLPKNVIPNRLEPEQRNFKDKVVLEANRNTAGVNRQSRGRRSHSNQPSFTSRLEECNNEDKTESGATMNKNVSLRRRASSLNICLEESLPLEDTNVNSEHTVVETERPFPTEEFSNESRTDREIDNVDNPASPLKVKCFPHANGSKMTGLASEAKQTSNKNKEEPRVGRERVKKGKAERVAVSQMKKPWENSKPRARSKSRDRSASKKSVAKEKMNSSLNSGDAFDFACEESIHVTPFRQNKQEESQNESSLEISSSEGELDDSLYKPYKDKSKNKNLKPDIAPVPLRSRSKRNTARKNSIAENELMSDVQAEANEKKITRNGLKRKSENSFTESAETYREKSFMPTCINTNNAIAENPEVKVFSDECNGGIIYTADEPSGASTPRISLSDVTNLPGNTDAKKHINLLFNEDEMKRSSTPSRKRRCKVSINYAEPKLSGKLRRGDPFTDSEFLQSPIFKNESKRNSLNRQSLSRYNEVFVGCRR